MKKMMGLMVASLALLSGCTVPEGGEESGTGLIPMLVFLVVIFAFFYFVMVRPQRKRIKEHEKLVQELKKGDQVVTAGGIYGTIESLSEESIVIKVESGGSIRVARNSVALRQER